MKYLVYLDYSYSTAEEVEANSFEDAEEKVRYLDRGTVPFSSMDLFVPEVEEVITTPGEN